jgi:WD40 repeat protein
MADSTVKLWDAGSGAVLHTLEGHSGPVYAVAFSQDGKVLVSASVDRTFKLWDAGSGAALQTLEVDAGIEALSFSVDGACLETNRGLLHTTYLSPGTVPSRPNLPGGVFVKDECLNDSRCDTC